MARCSSALPRRIGGCSRSSRVSLTSRLTSATAAAISSPDASNSPGACPSTCPRSPPRSATFKLATRRTSVVVSISSSGGDLCMSIGTSTKGTNRSSRTTADSILAGSRNTLPRADSVTARLHSLLPPQRFQNRTLRSSARVLVPLRVPPTVHLPPPSVRPSPVDDLFLFLSSRSLSMTLASTRAVTVRIAPPASRSAASRRRRALAFFAASESSLSGGGFSNISGAAETNDTRSADSPCSRLRWTSALAAARGVRSWSAAGAAASALATPPPSPLPLGVSRGVTAGFRCL
mmetsp:Transcript_3709/g.17085  ORF Transcript_3709/g.17085 Transcript_3709/m.17085 type:complete len:291 (+) Transcript_3709:425-1297(+)